MLDILTVKKLTTDIKTFSNFFYSGKTYDLNDLQSLPNLPGIYVVALNNKKELEDFSQILYIGVATQQTIEKRWQNHHKIRAFKFIQELIQKLVGNTSVVIYTSSFNNLSHDNLRALEEKLIYDLKPPFNEVINYPVKYYWLQFSQTHDRLARTMRIVAQDDDYMTFSMPLDVGLDLKELIVSCDLKKLIDYGDYMEKLYGHKD
ncbi:MAG: hypothetical protein RMZ41_021175 [Nostoc sp. DedVER02]|uniref:hypothetical protein n=1 Tax=unclassified Nostoc TaxID=2593658 RepID=UPI002AD2B2A7|nr:MULTISPECIES: hypothetical protein [unclassified Nostoc]MDZ7986471.1 hypothetical protein [Nostoc sp. DedVER02]MDZ8114029.1 hypothetical protein [Nostoc sp. DedVER01b]